MSFFSGLDPGWANPGRGHSESGTSLSVFQVSGCSQHHPVPATVKLIAHLIALSLRFTLIACQCTFCCVSPPLSRGLPASEAEMLYMQEVEKMEGYGQESFQAKVNWWRSSLPSSTFQTQNNQHSLINCAEKLVLLHSLSTNKSVLFI